MIDLNSKTILVTGNEGFIGSNFVEYIYKNYNNITIIGLDKGGIGSRRLYFNNLANKYYDYPVDISEIGSYSFILETFKNIDFVFNFAAESHVDRSIQDPTFFIKNNVTSVSVLLDLLKKNHPNTKIIHISTDEVYGHLGLTDKPFTEFSPLRPRSPYSASKAASDLVALSYAETFSMDVRVTRCCNNYGPNQHDEKFIPTVIRNLVNGTKIPVYGTGENIREWIFVEDHNKSILEIAEWGKKGEVYNIGSGVEMTNLEMIWEIVQIIYPYSTDIDNYVEFVTDRLGHDFRYAIDSKKYIRGFELTKFKEGLKTTVNFYLNKYKNG
jgi:dTDP-glucose 4,6-dehydratase